MAAERMVMRQQKMTLRAVCRPFCNPQGSNHTLRHEQLHDTHAHAQARIQTHARTHAHARMHANTIERTYTHTHTQSYAAYDGRDEDGAQVRQDKGGGDDDAACAGGHVIAHQEVQGEGEEVLFKCAIEHLEGGEEHRHHKVALVEQLPTSKRRHKQINHPQANSNTTKPSTCQVNTETHHTERQFKYLVEERPPG